MTSSTRSSIGTRTPAWRPPQVSRFDGRRTSSNAVSCYLCGATEHAPFITAQDDLGGTPGTFQFVRCTRCELAYQNPRVSLEHIGGYYDDNYIAHRKKRNWGLLTPLFERAMNKLDADKDRIVSRYVSLGPSSQVLDVGCAVGTFLQRLRRTTGAHVCGVDFKDLTLPRHWRKSSFTAASSTRRISRRTGSTW